MAGLGCSISGVQPCDLNDTPRAGLAAASQDGGIQPFREWALLPAQKAAVVGAFRTPSKEAQYSMTKEYTSNDIGVSCMI